MYTAIVVGTNGSETAARAVAHAAAIATASNATLHIVSSIPMRTVSAGEVSGSMVIDSSSDIESNLADALAAVERDGLTVKTHGMKLDPAKAIVEVAKRVDADLVVVGNKGMKGAKRFLLGSVPNAVAHNAPCAVLIVKTC
ncbi:MAG TPA: universal stress protein [Jatrophihabitantaceae bacterium]|nr:universal stress protein [Jatrophihabitantaceae bacterium]